MSVVCICFAYFVGVFCDPLLYMSFVVRSVFLTVCSVCLLLSFVACLLLVDVCVGCFVLWFFDVLYLVVVAGCLY